jgi:hypothetical protein
METKHTQAPWKRGSEIKGDEYSLNILGGEHNGIIAKANISVYLDDEQAEANAKLIAAAPELLEALTKLLGFAHKADAENLMPDEAINLSNTINIALSVIKKATE